MKRKFSLVLKVFNTFGFADSIRFVTAHVAKIGIVYVFVKELGRKILIRPWTGDFATIRQVLWDKEYDFDLPGAMNVIDLGANIGISTIVLANKFPEARVIALEPEKFNFNLLSINTRGLGNITVLNNAAWYKDAVLEIIDSSSVSNSFQFTDSNKSSGKQSVESLNISSIMRKYNFEKIDLLKIDIEGAEEELFDKGDLDWLSKTNCCVIEVHTAAFKIKLMDIMKNDFSNTVKGEKIIFTKIRKV